MQHLKDVGCKIYLGGEAVVQVTGGQVRLPFVCRLFAVPTYPAQDEGRGVRAGWPACAIREELFFLFQMTLSCVTGKLKGGRREESVGVKDQA
jgi:hypothetical protein